MQAMATKPLNHFDPVLLIRHEQARYSYRPQWDVTCEFARSPELTYIADSDFSHYDNDRGFTDSRLDLCGLTITFHIDEDNTDHEIRAWGFRLAYKPYSVDLAYARRMVATLQHIETTWNAYAAKGLRAGDVESEILQTLDAVGCTLIATQVDKDTPEFAPREGPGNAWTVHGVQSLGYQLRRMREAFAESIGRAASAS
jgi:hypothetical protein